MRLHAEQGARGVVLDLDTGRRVPRVIWLDLNGDGLGHELEAYQVGDAGGCVPDGNGNWLTYRARGRFRWIPTGGNVLPGRRVAPKPVPPGAPACARCRSPLVLPGDELCPPCRADDRLQRNRLRPAPVRLGRGLLACKCCNCSRPACWAVADEVAVSPQQARGRLWERGYTAGRRYYCDWCWKPPRILDARGEVVEELEDGGGLHPGWHS